MKQPNISNKRLLSSGSEMFTTSTIKQMISSPQYIPDDERELRGDKILTSDFEDY